MSGIRFQSTNPISRLSDADINKFPEQFNAATGTRYAFSRIPEEILVCIFSEVMRKNSQAIGSILFVCRLWNRVACNTPTLWTNIVSKPDPNPPSIDREKIYIQSAIRYSKSLPLDVTLHLISRENIRQDMAEQVWPFLLAEHPDYGFHRNIDAKREGMVDWLKEVDELESYCTRTAEVTDSVHRHIDTFARNDSESGDDVESVDSENGNEDPHRSNKNPHRIYGLTIYYDSRRYKNLVTPEKDRLFQFFRPAPERLTVIDTDRRLCLLFSNVYDVPSSNLKYLSWRAGFLPRCVISKPGLLVHLRLLWIYGSSFPDPQPTNLPKAEFTQNLRYLFLNVSKALYIQPDSYFSDGPYLFPRLEDLTLAGFVCATTFGLISAPCLSTLRLVELMEYNLRHIQTNPTIPLERIKKLHLYNDMFGEGKFTLEEVLGIFPSIAELGILGSVVDEVKTCLMRIKAEARKDGLSIKGFKYSPENYWSFDSYDHEEILVN